MDEQLSHDALSEYFADAFPALSTFVGELESQGETRGLIGPREAGKIWSRHILNSAALVPFLPSTGSIVDIGSGAGLPGLVIAAMLPGTAVTLVEPMERRCTWLTEMTDLLKLENVEVKTRPRRRVPRSVRVGCRHLARCRSAGQACSMVAPVPRPRRPARHSQGTWGGRRDRTCAQGLQEVQDV